MKKLFSIVLTLLAFSISTQNLSAQASLRAGINMASMSANATEANYKDYQNKSIIGYQASLVMPFKLSNNVAIQPELMWIQKGGKMEYVTDANNKLISTFTSNYIEIPVSLKLNLGNTEGGGIGFYVLGGPYAGLALNGKYKNDLTVAGVTSQSERTVDYSNDSNQEKRLDWGANVGFGVSLGKIYLDARYNLGINNLLDSDASNTNDDKPYRRNRGLGVSLGFYF